MFGIAVSGSCRDRDRDCCLSKNFEALNMEVRFNNKSEADKEHADLPTRKPSKEEERGSLSGLPPFLRTNFRAIHNSPPTSGPGSRGEPLVHGRRSVLSFADMQIDAYYRSPVNPDNPVLVWTDGTHLFFAPSGGQVATARTTALPEVSFVAPSGYVVEELQWDRSEGLFASGGALVVVARRPGQPDSVDPNFIVAAPPLHKLSRPRHTVVLKHGAGI